MTKSQTFDHIGGHPLVDLVNTEIMENGARIDLLDERGAAITWLIEAGIATQTTPILKKSQENDFLLQLREFRKVMRGMFDHLTTQGTAAPSALKYINHYLPHEKTRDELQFSADSEVILKSSPDLSTPDRLLGTLARTAADFLITVKPTSVKRCHHEKCIRYFIDSTKNRSRRWCSMEVCGNRSKAKSFLKRKKQLPS